MTADWRWLLGLLASGIAVPLAIFCYSVVRNIYQKISAGDRVLHDRLDKMEKNFVQKDHLDTHLGSIKHELNLIREDNRERRREAQEAHSELKQLVIAHYSSQTKRP